MFTDVLTGPTREKYTRMCTRIYDVHHIDRKSETKDGKS